MTANSSFTLLHLAEHFRTAADEISKFIAGIEDNPLTDFSPEALFTFGWTAGGIHEAVSRVHSLIRDFHPTALENIVLENHVYEDPMQTMISLRDTLFATVTVLQELAHQEIDNVDIIISDHHLKQWLNQSK